MANPFAAVLGRQLRTTSGKAEARTNLIRAVRAAAARMKLTDDDRHAIQVEVTGKASLTEMTGAEIGKVLDRLNRDRPAPMAHRAHQAKIKALWWTLYWLGAVDKPDASSIDAFVERQTGVATLRFLDHRAAPAVIEALKAWCRREGVAWPAALTVKGKRVGDAEAQAERGAVIAAIWRKLLDRRDVFTGSPADYAATALGFGTDPMRWTPTEQDAVIKLLGKRLRRAIAKAAREA